MLAKVNEAGFACTLCTPGDEPDYNMWGAFHMECAHGSEPVDLQVYPTRAVQSVAQQSKGDPIGAWGASYVANG